MPVANDTSLLLNKLGYYMHDGGHTVLPADWTLFIEYMKKYLWYSPAGGDTSRGAAEVS